MAELGLEPRLFNSRTLNDDHFTLLLPVTQTDPGKMEFSKP